MAETVATSEALESLLEGEQPAATTPSEEDVATIKRRLAGKDQALTRTQQEKAQAEAELRQAREKLAQYEQANMTEVERLQAALQAAEARAAQAQVEARKHALARKSPDYANFLDQIDGLDLTSEQAADAFEAYMSKRLAAGSAPVTEPEPRIDPNRPRRSSTTRPPSRDDILSQMEKFRDDGVLLGTE